jgi:gamma-glutamylcyclotransferase (GGCT)/AIG2-like uncharacterized protein YtfP|tara:strand:+ start:620 stop:991 length:372 start_codon:yes stop_codon:yes gene_type:complete
MRTNKLAVYGTLRDGKRDTWKVDGYSLVFPGHRRFPAALPDMEQTDLIVEVMDIDDYDLKSYDRYEGISSGLYERRMVNAYNNDEKVKAWMYTIGSALMQGTGVFEMVPKKDWMSEECLKLRT